ncbi:MAG: hypothetical protein H0T47_04130 [Planctomycetaceae bacterium]|nr:hypothetical protein [Planctomycetaceae bacterium]
MPYEKSSEQSTTGTILRDPQNPCGVTSVCVISHLLGSPKTLEQIRGQIIPDPLGRNSLAEVRDALESFGFETLALKMRWGDLPRSGPPMILHLAGDHFVVGAGFAGDNLVIVDPPYAPQLRSQTELSSWTGITLLIARDRRELEGLQEMFR